MSFFLNPFLSIGNLGPETKVFTPQAQVDSSLDAMALFPDYEAKRRQEEDHDVKKRLPEDDNFRPLTKKVKT